MRYPKIELPAAVHRRLGTLPDARLAAETGIPYKVLRNRREEAGIAVFSAADSLRTPASLKLIASMTVTDAAAHFGVSRKLIQAVREESGLGDAPLGRPRVDLPKAVVSKLGVVGDGVLAQTNALSRTTLRRRRVEMHKESPVAPGGDPATLPARVERRLGKEQDKILAEAAGVSASTIFRHRQTLGIPAFEGGRGRPRKSKR